MTQRFAARLVSAILPVAVLCSGNVMASPAAPDRTSFPSRIATQVLVPAPARHSTGMVILAKRKRCPKGQVWVCEKISPAMKKLGHKSCRCLYKGRSGH